MAFRPRPGPPSSSRSSEIGGLIGGLTGGIAGDLIGRRLPAMAVAIFGMLVIFLWWGVVWSLPVFCVLASVGGFVIGFEWTLGIVYVNEMFPTEIRATGFGWSVGLRRNVSIDAPIVTQTLAVTIGVATQSSFPPSSGSRLFSATGCHMRRTE